MNQNLINYANYSKLKDSNDKFIHKYLCRKCSDNLEVLSTLSHLNYVNNGLIKMFDSIITHRLKNFNCNCDKCISFYLYSKYLLLENTTDDDNNNFFLPLNENISYIAFNFINLMNNLTLKYSRNTINIVIDSFDEKFLYENTYLINAELINNFKYYLLIKPLVKIYNNFIKIFKIHKNCNIHNCLYCPHIKNIYNFISVKPF